VEPLSVPRLTDKERPKALTYSLLFTRTAVQFYVWCGWAAYCAALVLRYTNNPLVENSVPYFATAFLALNVPVAFLAIKERAVTLSDGEQLRLRNGTALYRTATIVAFVLFCILPQHMRGPYGWFVERIIPTVQGIEATELLREAASGDPDAQNALGLAYAEGRLLPADPVESARWHLAAAGQDHRGSQVELCRTYFSDRADLAILGQAARWCGAAAQQGDPAASFLMANLYSLGRGVQRDRDEANRLYRTAAAVDLVESYRWLTLASSSNSGGADLTDVIELRESVRTRLSSQQLAEARRMVLEWQPSLPGSD
jgi:TPR repeat protein